MKWPWRCGPETTDSASGDGPRNCRSPARGATWLLLAILLAAGGCGRKTAPLPPQSVVPKAIDDLRYRLDDKGVELIWSYPQRSVQGERLDAIEKFEIYRAVVAPADYCSGCPLPFGPPRIDRAAGSSTGSRSGPPPSGTHCFVPIISIFIWSGQRGAGITAAVIRILSPFSGKSRWPRRNT